MTQSVIERIQAAVLAQRYVFTEHAYNEMDDDGLHALDVESALLTGAIDEVLTDDDRGPRYVVIGNACDELTLVGVVVRFIEHDRFLVVTVYEIK